MIRIRKIQRGDTILEVMICVAVIGLILTAAFALSSRNGTAQLQSQERGEAQKVAETQLELLKTYTDINKLPDNNYFCVKADTASSSGVQIIDLAGAATPKPTNNADSSTIYPADCKYQDGLFNVAIWSPSKAGLIGSSGTPYGVTVRWDAAGGKGREELKIFYNLYDTSNPNFSVSGAAPEVCNNGADDDNDGLTDFAGGDKGCASPTDTDETNPQCNNFKDDDADGKNDMTDPGCTSLLDNSESPDPVIPFSTTILGKDYTNCAITEGIWGDGSDGCFRSGNSMYAWREVKTTYLTPGLKSGSATVEITYQEHGGPAPSGYAYYNFGITFVGTPTDYNLPVGAPGVQKTYSIPVNIPDTLPTTIQLEWKNNIGIDPDIQIDKIRIYR